MKPYFLVGGGPSLKAFEWALLKNVPHVICINMAYAYVPTAEAVFVEDLQFIQLAAQRDDWKAFKGSKIFHALDPSFIEPALSADPDLFIIRRKRKDKFWGRSLEDGLSYSSNSMIGALNLADIMGADPIYLLGVDCNSVGKDQKNFHDEYELAGFDRAGDHQYESFKSDFENWTALHLRHKRVVNLNPNSAVTCWPRRSWREEFKCASWPSPTTR